MFKDKEIRKGIISSIIASLIFLIFFQPILGFIWEVVTKISMRTYSGYMDNIYKNAALGQRNWLGYLTLLFFLLVVFTLIMTRLLRFRKMLSRLYEDVKLDSFENQEDKEKYLEDKWERINKRITPIVKHHKKIKVFLFLYQICILLFFCDTIFKAYADLQLNTSFNQRLTVIAPYIEAQKEEELKSKWASMKTRKDYENINLNMENIAKSANVILPENLLK